MLGVLEMFAYGLGSSTSRSSANKARKWMTACRMPSGVHVAVAVAQRDVVRGSVVIDDGRVVHGNIRCAAIEIAHRVAAFLHQLANELVGIDQHVLGVVDEAALQGAPGLR